MENKDKILKIQNYIALRNLLCTLIIVISGGLLSIPFNLIAINYFHQGVISLIGLYLDLIFISNLISINTKIYKLMED